MLGYKNPVLQMLSLLKDLSSLAKPFKFRLRLNDWAAGPKLCL